MLRGHLHQIMSIVIARAEWQAIERFQFPLAQAASKRLQYTGASIFNWLLCKCETSCAANVYKFIALQIQLRLKLNEAVWGFAVTGLPQTQHKQSRVFVSLPHLPAVFDVFVLTEDRHFVMRPDICAILKIDCVTTEGAEDAITRRIHTHFR